MIALDPSTHRSYHYWRVFVAGLAAGQVYAYRAHGSFEPQRGHRFDGDKLLLDPYGLAIAVPDRYRRRRRGLRLEGRCSAPASLRRDDHLRAACRRFHPQPNPPVLWDIESDPLLAWRRGRRCC